MIAVTLAGGWAVSLLNGFVCWLMERQSDDPQLPRLLRSHLPFFSSLDERFSAPEQVLVQSLLDHFTVAGLRRHQLAVMYTCDVIGIEITDEEKQEHVESSRVAAILDKAQSNQWSDDLFQYNLWLIKADRPVRTRRLYLSAAARLMHSAGAKSMLELNQQSLERYMAKSPGSRANLSSVLRFAFETLGHKLALPARSTPKVKEPKPVGQLRALLRRIEAAGDSVAIEDLESTVAVALRIPLRAIRAKKWWPEKHAGRWRIVSQGESITCPDPLTDTVSRWALLQRSL